MVVGEFCMRDFIGPGMRVASTEDPKVSFNLLVDMFCLTVRLRVVDAGKGGIIIKEFAELFDKGGGKLRNTIRDDFVVESKV